MPRWNGGVIGVANNPTQNSAKGIWSLSEATKAIRAGLWPPSNAGADPYFENVTLLLPGDGTNGAQNNTFLDSSTNNFTITRNGNTTQGTFSPFSKVDGRWGAYFDGSGDYLTAPSNSAFAVGSVFTIEFWLYPTAYGANPVFIFLDESSGGLQFGLNSGNLGVAASGVAWRLTGSAGPTLNAWNHCVLVRSGTGSNQTSIFLNGTRIANGTVTDAWTTNVQAIIQSTQGTSYLTTGYMSNIRIVKGTAVYDPSQSTLTVPTGPLTAISGTSLLTCQSNRFIDNSTNAFAITRNGDVAVTTFSPFPTLTAYSAGTNGGSGYFDGSGDYLSFANNAAFDFGTGDMTIECWFYLTGNAALNNNSTRDATLFAAAAASGSQPTNYSFGILANNTTTGTGLTFHRSLSGADTDVNYTGTITKNEWHHFAAVRSGSNLSVYYDGTRVAINSSYSGNIDSGGWSLKIGALAYAGYLNEFPGYISGLRVLKGTAQYSGSTYTIPTAPPTAVTNTSLLTNFTNGGIIDTSMSNDLETVGNAQISTTESKFGGASFYLDGTDDNIVIPYNPIYSLSTGDFTVEGWFYFTNISTTARGIVALGDGANGGGPYNAWSLRYFGSEGSNQIAFSRYDGTSYDYITSGFTISANTWYHIAVARASGTLKIFVNGTSYYSNTVTTNFNAVNTNPMRIGLQYYGPAGGYGGPRYWGGYIDDLRITKGYARYTANFTAPVGPFNGFGD